MHADLMSPTFPDESPADEYDRRLAERRGGAKLTIRRCCGWWLLGHVCAAAVVPLLLVGIVVAANGKDDLAFFAMAGAAVTALATPVLTTIPAGRAAFVAIRHRAVLSWPWIAYGLAPWLGLCTELSLLIGVRLLVRLV